MIRRISQLIILTLLLSGCALTRHAVPNGMLQNARIMGRNDIRAISGIPSKTIAEDLILSISQESDDVYVEEKDGLKVYSALAISGGSAYGAYGAGLLKGWSKNGTRPKFKIVTGISTGAIIAPFAFLGSEYDAPLERYYTTHSTKDVIELKWIFDILFGNSLASTTPLENLIAQYFDEDTMKLIAKEHQEGRRLYIGTTNLDAQRLVIWDMGKIASIGGDEAAGLFRKIILASASIPTAFPPVYFNAQIDGKLYNEMHVDGGVVKQVFFIYDILKGFGEAFNEKGINTSTVSLKTYVIRNGYANPVWQETPDTVPEITKRSVDALLNAQGIGDLFRLYAYTTKAKGDFNLAYIPDDFVTEAKELFDPDDMKRLFDLGFKEASEGYSWRKAPPGM